MQNMIPEYAVNMLYKDSQKDPILLNDHDFAREISCHWL